MDASPTLHPLPTPPQGLTNHDITGCQQCQLLPRAYPWSGTSTSTTMGHRHWVQLLVHAESSSMLNHRPCLPWRCGNAIPALSGRLSQYPTLCLPGQPTLLWLRGPTLQHAERWDTVQYFIGQCMSPQLGRHAAFIP